MRRSLALIAVGVAVAVAAAVIVAGVSSGGETGATPGDPAAGDLPSGHPSVAVDQDGQGQQTDGNDGDVDPGDGLARLEERRQEDPDDIALLLDLGNAYFMAQRLQQAERAYSDALALAPDSAKAKVGLAMVWHAQGDSKRAEAALRAVIGEDPEDQDAHYSLAIVCFSLGRIDEAKDQWETAAAIDPASTTGRRSQSFVDLLEDRESSAPAAD